MTGPQARPPEQSKVVATGPDQGAADDRTASVC